MGLFFLPQVDPKHVDIESLNQHAAELLSADENSNQAMMIVETMDDINDRSAAAEEERDNDDDDDDDDDDDGLQR